MDEVPPEGVVGSPDPMHVALHEAAHAVVGVSLGLQVVSVSVEAGVASLGRTAFGEAPSGYESRLVSLAGAAMNYELGLLSGIGCDSDALDALDELDDEGEFDTAFREALTLVRARRGAIDVVGQRLLAAGTIDGHELQTILDQFQ